MIMTQIEKGLFLQILGLIFFKFYGKNDKPGLNQKDSALIFIVGEWDGLGRKGIQKIQHKFGENSALRSMPKSPQKGEFKQTEGAVISWNDTVGKLFSFGLV